VQGVCQGGQWLC